ncbi:MAG TPA: CHAT domain-containing protein, partial [Allocoleopsis sp.]
KAQQFTVQATTLAQSLQAEDIVYQWQWQLGRLLQQGDDREGAIAAYTTATRTLEQVRQNLLTIEPDLQFSFRENVEPLYRELVDLLLKSDDATEPAHENLRQAIRTISELQQAELENFLRCNLEPQQSLDEADPDPTAAFIYPIILRDRLEVILKLPQGKQYLHYQTPLSQTEINQVLVHLRSGLEDRSISPEVLNLSQQVYNWLIHPAEVALEQNGVKTLVFLLDGTFRNVPMAALYDGQQYLIERYAIALAPSLQLPQPRPLAALKLDALIFGLSQIRAGFQPHQGFSSLPNVETELAEIRSQIPSQQRLNAAFTADALERMVSTSSEPIIHLATHGQFSSNPEQTFILSWDARIDVNRLSQILRNRDEHIAHPIELLILSACRTADGDDRAALGLAGLAVRLGARSTIASLWDVNDLATAQLMQVFYQQLASADRALTRAEALRQAQLSLLQAEREGYNVPFFWAPYVLVGNWL